jgi:O-antigen/teichoic acid export membrane protein
LFLGIYLNLSIWYKLTDKTIIGAYISGTGVLITILINFYFIPKYGYWASTWATIASYFSMMVISYIWGQYKYPVPYNIYKNIIVILITMVVSLVYYQYLKENIWLGNVIFLFLATFLLRKEKLIPAKILNKLGIRQ